MQEISAQLRRFQQIKNREKQIAIARAQRQAVENAGKEKIRQANSSLSENQVSAVYQRTLEIQSMKKG